MKKGMKQILALLFSTVMIMGMLAGCGGQAKNAETTLTKNAESKSAEESVIEETAVDTSEHVELKMYLLGDKAQDFDEVYGKINEILEEKLNCSLEVDFLSWSEHDQKYSLLFSAQEDFDLIFTATSWAHYEQTAALGGFMPISEEFVQTYAPDIWEVVPEIAWEQAKIKGQPYMVPANFYEFGADTVAVRGDMMEKYDVDDIISWDEFKDFSMKAAKDGVYAAQGGPFYQYFQSKGMTTTGGTPKSGTMVLFNHQDPEDLNFNYILDWDGFTDYCNQVKEMADAGCWSPDVLNSNDDRQTGLLTGRTASMVWNIGNCRTYAKQANAENPDWNVTICDPNADMPKKTTPYINAGVSINANSKNSERAMMVLNEFYTNPDVYDLAMMGIEGKHWEAIGDDQYKVIEGTNYGVSQNCDWGWRNMNISRKEYIENRTPVDDVYDKIMANWNGNIKSEHIYDGFNFDSTDVTTQMAAVEANIDTYYNPLINGLVSDVDATIEEFRQVLEKAGIRDVLAELEKQATDYVASQQGK